MPIFSNALIHFAIASAATLFTVEAIQSIKNLRAQKTPKETKQQKILRLKNELKRLEKSND